jgi:uncharacterized membrane protein
MNIHPLFVHFPIGILVLYTAFEIFRFNIIKKQSWYFEIKAILSIIGTLAAYLTASTGELAEDIIKVSSPEKTALVEVHSMYAVATITVFSILAGSYLFEWLKKAKVLEFITKIVFLKKLSYFIQKYSPAIAIVGLVLITITGGLGASIVYGPNVDPFVMFIYNMFTNF